MTLIPVGVERWIKRFSIRPWIQAVESKQSKQYYKERSTTVEPMQSPVKDIFNLDRFWVQDNQNNRWLFVTVGIVI